MKKNIVSAKLKKSKAAPIQDLKPEEEGKSDHQANKDTSEMTKALIMILSTVALLVTFIYVYPFVVSLFGKQKEVFTNVEQLGQRHLELEQKVLELQKKQEDISLNPIYQDLVQRVQALEEKQKGLEKDMLDKSVEAISRMSPEARSAIDLLKDRLDKVEEKLATRQDRMTKLPMAMGLFEKLKDRMEDDKPFDQALREAKHLFDPKDELMQKRLQDLEALSVNPIASIQELGLEFRVVAKEIRRLSVPADSSWYERFKYQLSNLVVVRKQGEPLNENSTHEDHIARIQHLLEASDLEEAMKEIQYFSNLESDILTEWKNKASARLFLQQSIPIMEAHVLAFLIHGEGETPAVVPQDQSKEG
ncbi:MAG: hypothetical protein KBB83_02365 [Alphaproteobacteria bacterium]|nr:hypothetical protein [Alphaproteobacteria bacterium]